ncbi:hypothetical protein SAMN05446935_7996 [Burkholderia sp. YR290]|nr:hypothetical protein SAMN05446935_7996 [Burkholderia sp. YR290]
MLVGTFSGFEVNAETYVRNRAFGRPRHVPDIFGFRDVVVQSGFPENDAAGIRFQNEEHGGYRDSALRRSPSNCRGTIDLGN